MTQTKLNHKFAEAYGVAAERKILHIEPNLYLPMEQTIQINEDMLTLFQLCIEHRVTVSNSDLSLRVWTEGSKIYDKFYYMDYATKESATCAAMWSALCKLKGIE